MALDDRQAYSLDAPPPADNWAGWMRQGMASMRLGSSAEAVSAFTRATALRPTDLMTALSYAAALLRTGSADQALAIYDRLLVEHPTQPKIHHARGLALNVAGDRVAAIDAFRTTVAIDAGAWRSWQSIADITPDEPERRHAIDTMALALERLCDGAAAPPALFATCVGTLIDAGRAADAIGFIDTHAGHFADMTAVHDARARAWYRQGQFEAAFEHKLAALRSLDPKAIQAPEQNLFVPDAAVAALRDIVAILEAAGVRPFLAAGTLLGFHRNGGPLPHDRDVDIGVIRSTGVPDIVAIVREHPGLLLRRDARPGDRYVALTHKGIGIDIFVHDDSDSHLLCGFSRHPGDIQWRFARFALTDADYHGERWRIPDRPERYLHETYGAGWREPDHGFASAINSPALHDVDPYARAYYAVARAKTAMLIGNTWKAAALIDQSPFRLRPWHPDASDAATPRPIARPKKEPHTAA